LHANGTLGAGIFQALPTNIAMLAEHEGHSLLGMGDGSLRDFVKPVEMAPNAGGMVYSGAASMGVSHACV
jgi:hypothetical protein